MNLVVRDIFTDIEGSYPQAILEPVTSYMVPGAWFSKKYKEGFWDGRARYIKYNRKTKLYQFPTGFLSRICKALNEANWKYTLDDQRNIDVYEPQYELTTGSGTIRIDEGAYDYQGAALRAALRFGRGIIQLPTGGGKTEVGAALIKSVGKQTLWLTHRLNLAYQTKARLEERLGEKIGFFGDGTWDAQRITVGMVQTLSNLPESEFSHLAKCEMFIGDEIHHLESDEWYNICTRLEAPYRFGLSATVSFENAGLNLLALTGDVIYCIDVQELIRRGVLVQPKIWFAGYETETLPKKTHFQTVYSQGIVNNTRRNARILEVVQQLASENKRTLVLVNRINHGSLLADLLQYHKISCTFVQGSTSEQDRKAAIAMLKARTISCMIATTPIFGEGVDVPFLEAIVNATGSSGGGGSEEGEAGRLTIQILGRGLRRAEGKTSVEYVDFLDLGHKFTKEAGLDRVSTLEGQGYADFIGRWEMRTPL